MTDEEWRQSDEGKASIERATRPMAPFLGAKLLQSLEVIRDIQQRQATTGRIFETKKSAADARKVSTEAKSPAHAKKPTDTEFLRKFTEAGSTTLRRKFFNSARDQVISLRKKQGRNVSVTEHPGQGTTISVDRKKAPTTSTTGACCSGFWPGLFCSITTESDCLSLDNGHYLGNGSTCSGVDCNSGACCLPDPAFSGRPCDDTIDFLCGDCAPGNSCWQGYGSACDTNRCEGACKITAGCVRPQPCSCTENLTYAECVASLPEYLGSLLWYLEQPCSAHPCGDPISSSVGACCNAACDCFDSVTESGCTDIGGTYWLEGGLCPQSCGCAYVDCR